MFEDSTERPFSSLLNHVSSLLNHEKRNGFYHCAKCGNKLLKY